MVNLEFNIKVRIFLGLDLVYIFFKLNDKWNEYKWWLSIEYITFIYIKNIYIYTSYSVNFAFYFNLELPLSCMSCQKKCRTFGSTFWKDIGMTFLVHLMSCDSDLWIKLEYFAYSLILSNCLFFNVTILFILNLKFKKVELWYFL